MAVTQMDENSPATGRGMCYPQAAQIPSFEVLEIAHTLTVANVLGMCCLLAVRSSVLEELSGLRVGTVLDLLASCRIVSVLNLLANCRNVSVSDLFVHFAAVPQILPHPEHAVTDMVWRLFDSTAQSLGTSLVIVRKVYSIVALD